MFIAIKCICFVIVCWNICINELKGRYEKSVTFVIDDHLIFEQAYIDNVFIKAYTYHFYKNALFCYVRFIFMHWRTWWGGTDMLDKWSSTIILLSLLITILCLLLSFNYTLFYSSLFIVNISSSIILHWWMVRLRQYMDYFALGW